MAENRQRVFLRIQGVRLIFYLPCRYCHAIRRVASHGSVLYIQTDEHAPKCKVVTVDLSREEQDIRDFIPEHEEAKLTQISRVNKTYFVVIYKRNVILYTRPSIIYFSNLGLCR